MLTLFDPPVELVAYLGRVRGEYSTGKTTRRGGILRAGNARARRKLNERPEQIANLPDQGQENFIYPEVQGIPWKAQARVTARYRALCWNGQKTTLIPTAIARKMAAFMWDIARRIMPAH